jgi:hypothetical protein
MRPDADWRFAERYRELIDAYLRVGGWRLEVDLGLRLCRAVHESGEQRLRLSKLDIGDRGAPGPAQPRAGEVRASSSGNNGLRSGDRLITELVTLRGAQQPVPITFLQTDVVSHELGGIMIELRRDAAPNLVDLIDYWIRMGLVHRWLQGVPRAL